MDKYLVPYTKIPTFQNTAYTAVVMASDSGTARELVKRRLNDMGKVSLYVIEDPQLYQPTDLDGKILTMGY